MPVLRPLPKTELNSFFSDHSLKVFQHFMNVALFAQPEVHKDKDGLAIQIPKEHLEQWFVQALKVESVGAGSYPIDILAPTRWGADIKMLSCNLKNDKLTKRDSGETSLAQKFTGTGVDLDKMFKDKEFQAIIDGWLGLWHKKLEDVKIEKEIDKIYYFFFLRGTTTESYLCGFEVDTNRINTTHVTQRDADDEIKSSIFLNGIINEDYGSSKIYKAKKRLELRLKPKKLLEDNFLIPIKTQIPSKENIYNLVQDKTKYNTYIKSKCSNFLDYSKL